MLIMYKQNKINICVNIILKFWHELKGTSGCYSSREKAKYMHLKTLSMVDSYV